MDGDGLTDAQENLAGTNPRIADSDSDGLFDGVELSMGLNANNPDCDGDGFNDGAEVAGATDPLNKNEIPVGEGLSVLGLLVEYYV